MKRWLLFFGLAAALWGADPPVKMEAYNVAEAMLSIQVTTRWAQSSQNYVGTWVDTMRVSEVKAHSRAERAGLKRGMEIVAIEGQVVHGLGREELNRVLLQEVPGVLHLQVRSSPLGRLTELQIPVGK